jgi:hypothetical protein
VVERSAIDEGMGMRYLLIVLVLVGCGGGDPEEAEKEPAIPDVCEVQPRPQMCL